MRIASAERTVNGEELPPAERPLTRPTAVRTPWRLRGGGPILGQRLCPATASSGASWPLPRVHTALSPVILSNLGRVPSPSLGSPLRQGQPPYSDGARAPSVDPIPSAAADRSGHVFDADRRSSSTVTRRPSPIRRSPKGRRHCPRYPRSRRRTPCCRRASVHGLCGHRGPRWS